MTFSGENYSLEQDSYFSTNNVDSISTPEKKLLLAILERAILDYVGNDQKEAKEAELWIFSNDKADADNSAPNVSMAEGKAKIADSEQVMIDSTVSRFDSEARNDYVFTFSGVCQQLDLDVKSIRRIIGGMPKRGESRVAPWYKKAEAKVAGGVGESAN